MCKHMCSADSSTNLNVLTHFNMDWHRFYGTRTAPTQRHRIRTEKNSTPTRNET